MEPKASTAPCASRTMEQMEKTGYLNEEFRLFHLCDRQDRAFPYHYHDFHKVIVFLSGKVTYHIEGKSYHLKPWDILLVSRHAIHRPEIDAGVPYERFILYVREELTQGLLTQCFQKAADRSFSLIRLNPKLQERLKDILYELERSLHAEAFGNELLCTSLFTSTAFFWKRSTSTTEKPTPPTPRLISFSPTSTGIFPPICPWKPLPENIISANITSCGDLKRRPDTPCTATLSASGFSWPANSLQTARL